MKACTIRSGALALLLTSLSAPVAAQAPVSGLSVRTAPEQGDKRTAGGASIEDDTELNLAIPAGAGAAISDDLTGAAGPLIGFQVWKLDKYLMSAFFTFAPTQEVSGSARDFGAFLLTPPGRGTSFSFAGNRVFPYCIEGNKTIAMGSRTQKENISCEVSKASLFYGFGGRAGITNTTWKDGAGEDAKAVSGSVGYLNASLVLTSKTYSFTDQETNETNEYQFGLLAGYGVRHITGDLALASNDEFRMAVANTARKTFHGPEFEFFVRMNTFRPYFRYSRFELPAGVEIPGLSGGQVVFGVDVLSSIFTKKLKSRDTTNSGSKDKENNANNRE